MRQPKPTGLVLVGFLIICFLLGLAQAESYHSASESLNKLKEFQSDPVNHGQAPGGGQLKLAEGTFDFPWATHHISGSKPYLPGRTPEVTIPLESLNEDIFLDGSREMTGLQKLSALNVAKQRNLTNIAVTGKVNASADEDVSVGAEDAEPGDMRALLLKMRDNATADQVSGSRGSIKSGNYLNVDVHGISVQAINTVEGGNAVATSNIIIKPVQTIIYAPEVQERLE
jgi:hypothetical protein